jgi:hypothetical protein
MRRTKVASARLLVCVNNKLPSHSHSQRSERSFEEGLGECHVLLDV